MNDLLDVIEVEDYLTINSNKIVSYKNLIDNISPHFLFNSSSGELVLELFSVEFFDLVGDDRFVSVCREVSDSFISCHRNQILYLLRDKFHFHQTNQVFTDSEIFSYLDSIFNNILSFNTLNNMVFYIMDKLVER